MASNSITIEIAVPGWRYALARAAVRLVRPLAFIAPRAAVRIAEIAVGFVMRGVTLTPK